MPLSVKRLNRLYRLVEPDGTIAKSSKGKPRDGGGHFSRRKALKQQRAIASSKRNRMAY